MIYILNDDLVIHGFLIKLFTANNKKIHGLLQCAIISITRFRYVP